MHVYDIWYFDIVQLIRYSKWSRDSDDYPGYYTVMSTLTSNLECSGYLLTGGQFSKNSIGTGSI